MSASRNKFTFKIILSYLVLGVLSVLVALFLYSEFEKLTSQHIDSFGEKKFIETGSLINLVYEADGFARIALLTEEDSDFEKYMLKTDSLFLKIKEIKSLSTNEFQLKQLDSVKSLLIEKSQNIEQLRILTLTNKKDTSLDEIMKEVQKLEASIGVISVETLYKDPSKLSKRERRIWQSYAEYLNNSPARDTATVKSKTVDSMLAASRYIVSEAKKANSRISKSLLQKENELIRNDLNISERLREIIASFDSEITKKNKLELEKRKATIERAGAVLKYAGIIGGVAMLIFSYLILSDFFRAERYKKNLEESKAYAEYLLKSREQLISTVSHDLKTPLNSISGYSELFENFTLSEKQKYYLSQITSSTHFISQLVDDLLDFSKLEAGKLSIEKTPFSLENILIEAGNAVKQLYPDKPVALKISIPETLKGQIFLSDPLRIRQIINNLVGNAFKFTAEGSVEIKVELLKTKKQVSTIQIAVIDTGIGISEEKQQLIFNEFTQAESNIAHKFGGSGLGLAISKKLTELLNGTLKVQSIIGKGSTFTLTLSLENSKTFFHKKPETERVAFKNLKGVVIDDDHSLRSLTQEMLQQMGVETQSFDGLLSFQNSKTDYEFDFILTDIQMPNNDGFSVLKSVKRNEVDFYNRLPVIAMTGSREHTREFYLNQGFDEMLPKPFTRESLNKVLQTIFPKHITILEVSNFNKNTSTELNTNDAYKNGNFDLSLLKSFVNSTESLREILALFNKQTEKDLTFLKEAVNENNVEAIKDTAHRMLTMSRQIKAVKIISILEKMESYPLNKIEKAEMESDLKELEFWANVLLNELKKV